MSFIGDIVCIWFVVNECDNIDWGKWYLVIEKSFYKNRYCFSCFYIFGIYFFFFGGMKFLVVIFFNVFVMSGSDCINFNIDFVCY